MGDHKASYPFSGKRQGVRNSRLQRREKARRKKLDPKEI